MPWEAVSSLHTSTKGLINGDLRLIGIRVSGSAGAEASIGALAATLAIGVVDGQLPPANIVIARGGHGAAVLAVVTLDLLGEGDGLVEGPACAVLEESTDAGLADEIQDVIVHARNLL